MADKLLSAALLLLLLPADAAAFCSAGTLIGNVTYVRTAETIELGGVFLIRLQGLAAPELDEPDGSEAKAAMRAIALGKKVQCELSGAASYDHCIAVCYLDDVDIAEQLIRQGHARDCPRSSGFRYKLAELEAGEGGATITKVYHLPSYCGRGQAVARRSHSIHSTALRRRGRLAGKGEATAEATAPPLAGKGIGSVILSLGGRISESTVDGSNQGAE